MVAVSLLLVACALAAGVRANDGIPITIEEPAGFKGDDINIRYHLAHFGAVPYGTVFDRARVHSFDPQCMCGSVKCSTGCGDFQSAQPADKCKPRIVEQGGLSRTAVNAFLVEEEDQVVCTRSTIAYNTARSYSDAVIIVAKEGEKNLVAAVGSKSAIAQDETLLLEHVNIPVGVVTHEDGGIIKKARAKSTNDAVFVKMNFRWLLDKNNAGVTIQVWHTTDDACGPPCARVKAFLTQVADMAEHLGPDHPITVEPRFLFVNCSSTNPEMCERSCVSNNRYCYERFTNMELYGSLIAEENIRQLCLFDTLKGTPSRDTRKFWLYKKFFQRNCETEEGAFNKPCSMRAFDSLQESSAIKKIWLKCFGGIDGDNQIKAVETEVKKMHADKVTAWLGSTVVVSGEHFRGSLDLAHVMKAACASMTDEITNSTVQCQEWTKGACTPGSEADRVCRNPRSASQFRTVCRETLATPEGYRCECDQGYQLVASDSGGGGQCTDVNECELYPTLCNRGDLIRNACQNTKGSYRCKENIRDECTDENNYGQCWSKDVGARTVSSCIDNFAQYKANLQNGVRGGSLHSCDCESINGCWVGGGGACTRTCPFGDCNPLTKECDAGGKGNNRKQVVAAALGISVAVLVAIGALIGFFVIRRHQRSKNDAGYGGESDAQIGRYANFDASGNASERMSTGAISMGGIRDLHAPAHAQNVHNGNRAAGVAAYVARSVGVKDQQQSAFAPGVGQTHNQDQYTDVSLQDTSLNVQEHPES